MKQNGMNKVISLVCVAMLVLALPVMGSAATVGTSETTAIVQFKEGELKWDEASMKNMNLDFGVQPIPVGAVTYESINAPHSITIDDPRIDAKRTQWKVDVKMTNFVATSDSFDGTVTLTGGVASEVNSKDASGVVVESPIAIVGTTAQASAPVAVATGTPAGQFSIKWATNPQAKLSIAAGEVNGIVLDELYTAKLTWTLSTNP